MIRSSNALRRQWRVEREGHGEHCLPKTIEVARRRAARSPERRATTGLARLWHARGDREPARRLLAPLEGAARTPGTSRR